MRLQRNWKECEKSYREAFKLEPRCLVARTNLAAVCRTRGDNNTALQISGAAVAYLTTVSMHIYMRTYLYVF